MTTALDRALDRMMTGQTHPGRDRQAALALKQPKAKP
jgi:hypothetical protein